MIAAMVFVLGFVLCLPTLASMYRVRDLWRFTTRRGTTIATVLVWIVVHLVLGGSVLSAHSSWYFSGLLAFALLHVTIYWALRVWTRKPPRTRATDR